MMYLRSIGQSLCAFHTVSKILLFACALNSDEANLVRDSFLTSGSTREQNIFSRPCITFPYDTLDGKLKLTTFVLMSHGRTVF
jgi:hypothetical protein